MADPTIAQLRLVRSPFEGHAAGRKPNVHGHVGVLLGAGTLPSVLLLSTWVGAGAGLEAAVERALGIPAPGRSGLTTPSSAGLLMRTGPEEFMLIGSGQAHALAALRQAVGPQIGTVIDLSHARCRIRLTGAHGRTVLGKLFALDLRESSFPVGEVRLSGTHHVPCTLHRRDADAFDLYVLSTYAWDQLATLMDAALEYGVALEHLD